MSSLTSAPRMPSELKQINIRVDAITDRMLAALVSRYRGTQASVIKMLIADRVHQLEQTENFSYKRKLGD
jgi:hypothetical protein